MSAAGRVPRTIRASPRMAARYDEYRTAGPSDEWTTAISPPRRDVQRVSPASLAAASTWPIARASGTTMMDDPGAACVGSRAALRAIDTSAPAGNGAPAPRPGVAAHTARAPGSIAIAPGLASTIASRAFLSRSSCPSSAPAQSRRSTEATRGGAMSRSTSQRLPPCRSAITRASVIAASVKHGMPDDDRTAARSPPNDDSPAVSHTTAPTRRPANGTRTRDPTATTPESLSGIA